MKVLVFILCFIGWTHAALAKEALPNVDPKIAERFKAITSELRCQKCQNQTLYASAAGLADDLKRQVTQQINSGKTDEEIIEYMVERYGEFIRYRPDFNTSTVLLWVGPFILLLMGGFLLIYQIKKHRTMISDNPLNAEQLSRAEALMKQKGEGS